ncbi:hypothetical protein [Streptomyces tsukubensis]|uniref:hypothetical protein n=1 Tax=Streptomyces tsukubensis TaxID=83656 RepID=UPI00098FA409|nr:hypothetical protein [Streptomyces tsukubensis]QFR95032.1 hypothetical protein GBW32_20885 [Streptomyces tsukubensis]
MKTAADFTVPPSDYRIVVPDGWFQLALEPEESDASALALAEQQFHGIDNAPHLKRELTRELQRQAREAYAAGGTELYLSTLVVGPVPLSSSLLISVPPPGEWPDISGPAALSRHLELLPGRQEVGVVELSAAGRVVRTRQHREPDPARQLGNTLPTTSLSYYAPIPMTEKWLVLDFSTPIDPLANQMVELFDTVAGTLHWL